jgi:CubicO group peptidase (beta-lactamase class C family)
MPTVRLAAAVVIAVATALASVRNVDSQGIGPSIEDIADLLEPIRAQEQVPSLAAAVTRGGRLIAQGAAGVRRLGGRERVTVDDKYHLGSNTKAMTATLLGVVVDEGQLGWTSTVGDVLGKKAPAMDSAWRSVTLEQLLRHRSGAPREPDAEAMAQLRARFEDSSFTPVERPMLVVAATITRPPSFTPGTRFSYANLGYVIAAAMADDHRQAVRLVDAGQDLRSTPYHVGRLRRAWQRGPRRSAVGTFGRRHTRSPRQPGGRQPAVLGPRG